MAITARTSTVTSGNAGASPTLVINSAVIADDILVLAVTNRDATSQVTVSDNDTGGNTWALLKNQAADTNGSGQVFWKRATSGTASKTITISGGTGSTSAVLTPFAGASSAANPFSQTTIVGEANASGNLTQAQITTARDGSMVILTLHGTSNDTLAFGAEACTSPGSLTEQGEGLSTTGSDCCAALSSAVKTTAGDTGAFTWSMGTAGTTASIALALEPSESLTIQDSSCASSTDNVVLTFGGGELTIQAASSGSSADNVVIVRNGGDFTIQDETSATSADNVALVGNLIIADSSSASGADNVVLEPGASNDLLIDDALSTSSSDNVVITRNGGDLTIQDTSIGSSAENVLLVGSLIVQDSSSASSADNVGITRNGGDFTVNDSGSATGADNVLLIGNLIIQDSSSNSSTETPIIYLDNLFIDDALSGSSADNIVLTLAGGDLTIQNASSASSANNVTLLDYIVPDQLKTIILADSGEIAIWIDKNVYIHAPPH